MELGLHTPPSDGVPYAFQHRVMANLPLAIETADPWFAWEPVLWRLAPVGALLLMLAVAGNWWIPDSSMITDEADEVVTATAMAVLEE